MKKVQYFILKKKEIFVGLEDSKKSWKLCVRSNRVVVHETSMPAEYTNLHNYFNNNFPSCRITVIYEAGFRGFGLFEKLVADGWNCIVTPPHTVTDEKCSRRKNDRIDCRRLAKNLENGDYKSCFVHDPEHLENRQVSRLSNQIQKDIVRISNRIRRCLEFHGLDEHFKPGKWTQRYYRIAESELKTMSLSRSLVLYFQIMFDELHRLQQLKKKVLRELNEIAKLDRYKERVKLLKSAPGIGILTAIRLVLEWGDVPLFISRVEFASFTGLIPCEYSSGEQEHFGHITKQGNRSVRAWMVESSWKAISRDSVLLDKYNRVIYRTGSSKKAIVAVARKLALRLQALLIKGEPYVVGLRK